MTNCNKFIQNKEGEWLCPDCGTKLQEEPLTLQDLEETGNELLNQLEDHEFGQVLTILEYMRTQIMLAMVENTITQRLEEETT